jgi:alginate O-acetyltransferase complex protein AlgI
MIFNDFGFLFAFLPLVFVLFYFPGVTVLRPYLLIAASLIFYSFAGIEHAIVLVADIVWVYFIVTRGSFRRSDAMLYAAIIPPAIALAYYKYAGFLITSAFDIAVPETRAQFSLFLDVLLPAGISFFTFQVISFAIDRHRGEIDVLPSLPTFATFISFFPQLVAGPILRYHDVSGTLLTLKSLRMDGDKIARGVGYICIGLAAKVLIADTLSHYIEPYRNAPELVSQFTAVYVVFAYSFQIYFDFYGYSMIAIGLGALFGFSFPHNFNRPYEAKSPQDFWRRWHMTLSFWIKDYLYIPLGGNKAYVRNIVIVMAACGLWHGAGWTFIFWGLYHAALVVTYHFTRNFWDNLPTLFQVAITFVLVSIGWILFLYDFDGVYTFILHAANSADSQASLPSLEMWIALGVAAAICFFVNFEKFAENKSNNLTGSFILNVTLAVLFVVTLIFLDRSETFIYFRF